MGPDRRIGTELGGYRIIEPLGQGATSVVYLAEHVRLGRAAALKLLAPALGEADFRERFLRESQLAASLDHPNIVPVYDAGEVDGLLYIAMASVPSDRAVIGGAGPGCRDTAERHTARPTHRLRWVGRLRDQSRRRESRA